ncbi:hypothetical protein T05_5475 [Trichinella murrelli]|uniref:Uncharacterized protein n=1 Tax=Trichinella murrelli TaxID=144512 RepID=A0A0V0T6K8_9BILA|nr:hypothetical protein T05_5475 [Trichinella murrelli]
MLAFPSLVGEWWGTTGRNVWDKQVATATKSIFKQQSILEKYHQKPRLLNLHPPSRFQERSGKPPSTAFSDLAPNSAPLNTR